MNLDEIKCVAFDADNTLYSTKKVAKEADMAAMRVLASRTNKTAEDLYNEFLEIVETVKDSPDPAVRHRKYSYGKLCAAYRVDVINEMYEAFKKVVIDKIEIVPGVLELLEKLKDKELYVITEDNLEMAMTKLQKLGIFHKFKGITTSSDAGTMKPSKNYYSELLGKFKPEEILVIGDDYKKDLILPTELGMKTFLADTSEKLGEITKIL